MLFETASFLILNAYNIISYKVKLSTVSYCSVVCSSNHLTHLPVRPPLSALGTDKPAISISQPVLELALVDPRLNFLQ